MKTLDYDGLVNRFGIRYVYTGTEVFGDDSHASSPTGSWLDVPDSDSPSPFTTLEEYQAFVEKRFQGQVQSRKQDSRYSTSMKLLRAFDQFLERRKNGWPIPVLWIFSLSPMITLHSDLGRMWFGFLTEKQVRVLRGRSLESLSYRSRELHDTEMRMILRPTPIPKTVQADVPDVGQALYEARCGDQPRVVAHQVERMTVARHYTDGDELYVYANFAGTGTYRQAIEWLNSGCSGSEIQVVGSSHKWFTNKAAARNHIRNWVKDQQQYLDTVLEELEREEVEDGQSQT
jgi:hypothetical protein